MSGWQVTPHMNITSPVVLSMNTIIHTSAIMLAGKHTQWALLVMVAPGKLVKYICGAQANSAFHPSWVGK